eukprot:scaffold62227_cov37-Prasinocladus_malaysianus.AAC.2
MADDPNFQALDSVYEAMAPENIKLQCCKCAAVPVALKYSNVICVNVSLCLSAWCLCAFHAQR